MSDNISLSEAGKRYLLENGIPLTNIRADEMNKLYSKDGVYNSGDECYVACQVANLENCNRIYSIVSPVQIYRKALFYIQFGRVPDIFTVPLENLAHNYIGELFFSLYVTYFVDHTWRDSFLFAKTRVERNADFKISKDVEEILKDEVLIPDSVKQIALYWRRKYEEAVNLKQENCDNDTILIDCLFDSDFNQLFLVVREIITILKKK